MPRGWRVGRIGGIQIFLDPSLLIIAALVVWNRWAILSNGGGISTTAAAALAVLTAVLFFGSILAHELAHAGMSRLRRIPVSGITLFMFGGATHAQIESRGPGDEFLVTVVGPGTSLALGGIFMAISSALRGSLDTLGLAFVFDDMGRINLLLGVFNLLPGFPLDGGRLLRSALWRATKSLARATWIAARVGQGIAALVIAWGVYLFTRSSNAFALWPAFIGLMLFRAATAALAEGERRKQLEGATASDVMSPPPPTVPAALPVEDALHRYLVGHEGEAFPVVEGDDVVGFVSLSTIRGTSLDRPVREAMVGTEGTVQARPADTLDRVADRLGEAATRTVLVMDGGRLVGVIEPEDLARFLRRKGSPGATQASPADGVDGPPARPDAP
jgi:Zn-dependent protease/predicted transcriptional regulator